MNSDRKIMLIILLIPAAAILIIFLTAQVKFDLSLSAQERKIYGFDDKSTPNMIDRTAAPVKSVRNPIEVSKRPEKNFPAAPLVEVFPPLSGAPGAGQKVSLIFVNKNSKMTIIDGKLLHEGDVFNSRRVVRIEKDRVLLHDKEGEKWLKLE